MEWFWQGSGLIRPAWIAAAKACCWPILLLKLLWQVSVYVVFERITNKTTGREDRVPLFQGQAVEVRLTAGPEQQVEAAKKLGAFCQKLLPFVLLKKI